MPINKAALARLRAATFTAEDFIKTMESMVGIQEMMGASGDTSLPLDYQEPGVEVKDGELIPFITIGLRAIRVVEVMEDEEGND